MYREFVDCVSHPYQPWDKEDSQAISDNAEFDDMENAVLGPDLVDDEDLVLLEYQKLCRERFADDPQILGSVLTTYD